MLTPIIESILSDPTGAYVRFRWHADPVPVDNSLVDIFFYSDTGEYRSSEYTCRSKARICWARLIAEGYSVIRHPEPVVHPATDNLTPMDTDLLVANALLPFS